MLTPTYSAPITPADLREPTDLAHPALRIAVERARAGSRPRHREDPHVLALAIEGGGMGGAVSAGMCVMLDALGLIASFDLVYGCSAGALNGLWTAAGQAPLGATNYEDAASREFISATHLLRGKPIMDMTFLFDRIATRVKPYSPEQLAVGPELRVLATAVERREVVVLRDFASPQETLDAVRASCALPLLGGELPYFRGELMADGGLVEAVPFQSALRGGATHVLVLRSRAATHRNHPANPAALASVAHQHPALRELLRDQSERYNAAVDTLANLAQDPSLRDRIVQITVAERDMVGRLEHNRARVVAGLQAGAREIAATLSREPSTLLWQPRAYRISLPAPASATADVPHESTSTAPPDTRAHGRIEAVRGARRRLRKSAATSALRRSSQEARNLATMIGALVGWRLPPSGSAVTITRPTPARSPGTLTDASPALLTPNSTSVGCGTLPSRASHSS